MESHLRHLLSRGINGAWLNPACQRSFNLCSLDFWLPSKALENIPVSIISSDNQNGLASQTTAAKFLLLGN